METQDQLCNCKNYANINNNNNNNKMSRVTACGRPCAANRLLASHQLVHTQKYMINQTVYR